MNHAAGLPNFTLYPRWWKVSLDTLERLDQAVSVVIDDPARSQSALQSERYSDKRYSNSPANSPLVKQTPDRSFRHFTNARTSAMCQHIPLIHI